MNAPLDAECHLRVAPSVYVRSFGDELVLLDFGRGEYFGLDPVGADVWRGLEAGERLDHIADNLVERYEVTREVALRDVVSLVTRMHEQGLLLLVPVAAPDSATDDHA